MSRGFTVIRMLPLLLMVLIPVAAFAQSPASSTAGTTGKVNVIIERELLRFETPGESRVWRVEVFNQTGEMIYASGQVNGSSLEWRLQDQLDKPLAGGLYAYKLTAQNEQGETAWTQRGHVIIDRAGASDRIWVASSNAIGVGSASELTVAGSPEATVGGASLTGASAPSRVESKERQAEAPREPNASTVQQKINPGPVFAVGPITGDGIAGNIAKFTGANTIDDSVMTENGGNIQVGTNMNLARLTAIHTNVRGIYGRSDTAAGVWGQSISSNGIYGYSSTGNGAYGYSIGGLGVQGVSSTNHGVYGTTASATFAGVFGTNNALNARGIWGVANNGGDAVGVYGESSGGRGVFGESQTGSGVRGQANSGAGVYGISFSGRGTWGVSQTGYGAMGQSNGNHGVHGWSTAAKFAGVYGRNTNQDGIGVLGEGYVSANPSTSGGTNQNSIGVYGTAGDYGVVGVGFIGHGVAGYGSFLGASIYGGSGINGDKAAWAGKFDGNVLINGTLQVNNNFAATIDHPLDPANKYLNQSFVESPEMMSVQTGNITTNANGEAVVSLPDYFSAMSGDFRYQLTVVGQFAQAIVAQKIEGSRFTIKTDRPNVEVSWQVTGLRQDAAAKTGRKPAEELKPEAERGHYLRPALFNQPEEKSIEWARHPEMMKRAKAEREQQKAKPQP